MLITFHLQYAAAFGQTMTIAIDDDTVEMTWSAGDWWHATADVAPGGRYRYRLAQRDGAALEEDGPSRSLPTAPWPMAIVDRWRAPDERRRSRTSALFTRSLASLYPTETEAGGRVTFRVLEPAVRPGSRIVVVGEGAALGNWDPAEGLTLHSAPYPWWEASADLPPDATAYKYVVVDTGGATYWESGPDRLLPPATGSAVVTDDEVRGLPGWRGAGVAVPVFALRSDRSLGSGQFTDIAPFAEWAAANHLRVIQLLPVNDTVLAHAWQDSYPYNPVSVQALHPLYIDLEAIEGAGIADAIAAAREGLEDLEAIDYVAAMDRKWGLLRAAYLNLGPELDGDDEFAAFVDDEWEWLGPYSAWATLRDRHGSADTTNWGVDAVFDPERIDAMADPGSDDYEDLRFHWFVQFHLRRQLIAAADHARSLGVALKGDLPIGVAPQSVDVWTQPELFHVGAQTGAPPDAFAVRGQNWKFPTYNWDRMAEDGYRWWRDRFTALAEYVDVYRIDHVLGFFRIWEVPPESDDGLLGHFRPSLPLSADEVRAAIGTVDIDDLTRPVTTAAHLERVFGRHHETIRRALFSAGEDDLRLVPGVATQRLILRAFDHGLLSDLAEAERAGVCRGLLDIAGDVLLLRDESGFSPRISWQDTEHYRRLSPEQQRGFDAMAIDFFHHRHSAQWEAQGRTTLPVIVDATDLLTCGEDLGMVPELVPQVMRELGLLSLEIERMPKRLGAWIADPAEAPYLSVVSPSTHDTTTLRMWWRDEEEATQRLWNEALGRDGERPTVLSGELAETLIRRQLASEAMLCIIPLTDLFAIDEALRRSDADAERINDPADRHNKWRYRMHLTIDALASAEGFNRRLRRLIAESGR